MMEKGILRIVEGDATVPQKTTPNEIVVITHICNDANIWGGGFVMALSKKWEEPERVYRQFISGISPYPKRQEDISLLGRTCYAKIDNHLVVANMIAQHSIVSEDNPKPIKYRSLANAMEEVVGYIRMIQSQTKNPVVIHAPKFGSLRAGGNWNFIIELIEEIWLNQNINVVIYEFKE